MNEKDIDRASMIDGYLTGRLTDEEMIHFNKQLKEDATLKAELENYEISRESIRNYALRNELKHIRQQMRLEEAPKPQAKHVSFWQYSGRVAAAVALLIVAFFSIQFATLSGEKLYKAKAFPDEAWVRRGPVASQTDQGIKEAFASGNYPQVITMYEAQTYPSVTATFIAGNAYLQQHATEKAIGAFQQVEAMNTTAQDKLFVEDTQYYLALSYLRNGDYEQALHIFEQIKASGGRYKSYVSRYFLLKLKALTWLD